MFSHGRRVTNTHAHTPYILVVCVCVCISPSLFDRSQLTVSLSPVQKAIIHTLCPDALVMQWLAQIPGNQRCGLCLQPSHEYGWTRSRPPRLCDVIAVAGGRSVPSPTSDTISKPRRTHTTFLIYGDSPHVLLFSTRRQHDVNASKWKFDAS